MIPKNLIRVKLLATYQNIIENSKGKSEDKSLNGSNNFVNEFELGSVDCSLEKHIHVEIFDNLF